jgi:hypothetical protein
LLGAVENVRHIAQAGLVYPAENVMSKLKALLGWQPRGGICNRSSTLINANEVRAREPWAAHIMALACGKSGARRSHSAGR